MFDSILVVCVGNICRSPTGEQLLRKSFPKKKISSAGLRAMTGQRADLNATAIAAENGISLCEHTARRLTKEICNEHELILAMEQKHIQGICSVAPEARGKIMLYAHWNGHKDIPDPYGKSEEAYEFVFSMLEEATRAWIKVLQR